MFFKVKTTDEVLKIIDGFEPIGAEDLPPEEALGRILSNDIFAPEHLPGFSRSSMDGYAVRSKDIFGASESIPAMLDVTGEVFMGQAPTLKLASGQAIKIPTGAMLPQGADGVVMIEYCQDLDDNTIEVSRAISPGENVIEENDDFEKGSLVLEKGRSLRPQDIGVLAGMGLTGIQVQKRPRVAIISSGDEVVGIEEKPGPGQVRDINSYTLKAFCRQAGAEPVLLGVADDKFDHLMDMVKEGMKLADTVWISGGSSVGTRDMTMKVFESLEKAEVLFHGISIRPGKPTILARSGSQALFGLPGHVASAMVVAEVFLSPFLARLSGERLDNSRIHETIGAKLTRNIESASGREDYLRVKLIKDGGSYLAEPIFGKSGLISTLVQADGMVKVDMNTEGLYRDQEVEILVFKRLQGGFF